LRAIAFDPARLETRGEATPVLSRVQTFPTGHTYFDLARDGTLVYVSAGAQSAERTLVWVDRAGEELIALPPRDEALKIASEIAEALDAAHRSGIVDFGLAKLRQPAGPVSGFMNSLRDRTLMHGRTSLPLAASCTRC
jgi:hypothetical protein